MNTNPFVIERRLKAPVSIVWKAITDPVQMKEWYFDLPDFRAEVGCVFTFKGGTEDSVYNHICKVLEVVPEEKLQYSWTYKGYEGYSVVTFLLSAEGDNTILKLTHEGLHTFPAIADFARKNFEHGWTDIIGRLLPDYLAQKSVSG